MFGSPRCSQEELESAQRDLYQVFTIIVNPCPAEPGYTLPLQIGTRIYPAFANSADPDQLASKKPTDLDLHYLQRQGISGF